jgi:prenyltransferase beta subunit
VTDCVCCSFASVNSGSEEDMRFVYCACAISYILDDWSGVDLVAMVRFVNSCLVRRLRRRLWGCSSAD